MQPSDFGLSDKFKEFRPGQWDAISDMAGAVRRFFLASIPTGGGKSPDYVTVHRILEARTLVLTANKGLQTQLMNDFGALDMEDIRGQRNYRCRAVDMGGELEHLGRPGQTCDEGPCHIGASCRLHRSGCLYFDQVEVAAHAPIVVTNYAYWLTMGRWSNEEKIGEFDLLVCDEAHRAPDILTDFCAIKLDRTEIRLLLGCHLPSVHEDPALWIEWASGALEECTTQIEQVKMLFKMGSGDDKRGASKRLRRLGDIQRALSDLNKASIWSRADPSSPNVYMPGQQTDWKIEQYEHGVQFLPVWAHAFAEQYLFRQIPKVILTSATLQPVIANYLGIAPSEYEYHDYDSTFDPEMRPIIWVPTAKIDRNATPYLKKKWIARMDEIVSGRLDRKGIIMARSYDWMDMIADNAAMSQHMITHTRRGLREAVESFKLAAPPSVLVSPSIDEGFDFPDDECRYIIIAKCPFVDSRSGVIQARIKSDKEYLNYLTSHTLIQQAGRGWRNLLDWCEVFIIDDNIRWFWPAARKQRMWPGYFVKSYRISDFVPDPPVLATGKRSTKVRLAERRPGGIRTRSQVRAY